MNNKDRTRDASPVRKMDEIVKGTKQETLQRQESMLKRHHHCVARATKYQRRATKYQRKAKKYRSEADEIDSNLRQELTAETEAYREAQKAEAQQAKEAKKIKRLFDTYGSAL